MATVDATEVLEICRKVEEGAARHYRLLAKLHQDRPGLAALWEKTAHEEDNHAQQISLIIRKRAIAAQVMLDLKQAERALTLIETAIEQARRESPTFEKAIEEAIVLEKSLEAFHADYAVRFSDPSWERLFKAMMAADRAHIGTLESALAVFRE